MKRKAAQKASWQRENRDSRRASERPVRISRALARDAAAEVDRAMTATSHLRTELLTPHGGIPESVRALEALAQVMSALERLSRLVAETCGSSRQGP